MPKITFFFNFPALRLIVLDCTAIYPTKCFGFVDHNVDVCINRCKQVVVISYRLLVIYVIPCIRRLLDWVWVLLSVMWNAIKVNRKIMQKKKYKKYKSSHLMEYISVRRTSTRNSLEFSHAVVEVYIIQHQVVHYKKWSDIWTIFNSNYWYRY